VSLAGERVNVQRPGASENRLHVSKFTLYDDLTIEQNLSSTVVSMEYPRAGEQKKNWVLQMSDLGREDMLTAAGRLEAAVLAQR